MRRFVNPVLVLVTFVVLTATAARAQEGAVSGVVRDQSEGVLPGVTVEATSGALIEKVRATVTDAVGRYQITNLPVGTYVVTFTLTGFNTHRREDIVLTSGFTAPVNAALEVGRLEQAVVVSGVTPTVDVQNARQQTVFSGEQLGALPTQRNPASLMALVPGIAAAMGGGNFAMGICSGGVGVFCSPNIGGFNAHTSLNDADGLTQGRLQVDGMVVNTVNAGLVTGSTGSYVADVANAQEVSFQLSGALGDSETGGATINIVPRTGGNRYAGNYFTAYTQQRLFARNDGNYANLAASPAQPDLLISDHDVSAALGGPVKRDRLWFYTIGRHQGKESSQTGGPFFYNLNAGKFGANYVPDRARGPVTYSNQYKNASTRLTWQLSQQNKLNLFWDEQNSCQDPCDGVVSTYTSPESWWSVVTFPNHVAQASWNNPSTNKLLFEAGITAAQQHYDHTRHRYLDNPQSIPRVTECGTTAGGDSVASRVNAFAGICPGFGLTSGSITGGTNRNIDNIRSRFAVSYISGKHRLKVGYEGAYYSEINFNDANGPRTSYQFDTPGTNCADTLSCGNTSLYYPQDPNNSALRPVPSTLTINTGPRTFDERVKTAAFYVQDQWTYDRFTLNGAIRYDHAWSTFNPTCVGPDAFVPAGYCTPAAAGVKFDNITPRFGAVWDVFGKGKTSIKFNGGNYLGSAGIGGLFTAANPARRTVNTYGRTWLDTNGNRMPDCNLLNFSTQTGVDTCGAGLVGSDSVRFGRDPLGLDEAGIPIGLATTQCGRNEKGIPAAVSAYCKQSGQNLLEGWGKRRGEWQIGIGVQHELLPRLSVEATYNRRWYQDLQITDTLGTGCDLFTGQTDACLQRQLDYRTAPGDQYNYYSVVAPVDPRLPGGGGYTIRGLQNRNRAAALPNNGAAVTLATSGYVYGWQGVDVNVVWRARGGLRLNGGTSTGGAYRDTCLSDTSLDAPNVRSRDGGRGPACRVWRPLQTNVSGTASYTVPKVDVLVSTVFRYRPGPEISANLVFNTNQLGWSGDSAYRATNTVGCPATTAVGCLYGVASQNPTVNLLDSSDMWGTGFALFDLKVAKNIRFLGRRKRVNIGLDVYNVFNSDAVVAYSGTYTVDNPATPAVEVNNWLTPTTLVPPRFARFNLTFDF